MPSEEEISRTLTKILRYDAAKHGLKQDSAGWVDMDELLEKCNIRGNKEEILIVVGISEGKQGRRFEVDVPDGGPVRVRATYTHGKTIPAKDREKSEARSNSVPRGAQNRDWRGTEDPSEDLAYATPVVSDKGTDDGTGTLEATQETWQKFRDPDSGHLWFYNSETEDFFFEVTAHEHGWTMYNSAQGPWWFHASEGRFFFDPLMA